MAERKVFGRLEFPYDDKLFIVQLTKRGVIVKEKRKHNSAWIGIRSLIKMLEPQAELFIVNQPKPITTEGERAISEMKEIHRALAIITGMPTDGQNWRHLLDTAIKPKDTNERKVSDREHVPIADNQQRSDPGPGLPLPEHAEGG